MPSGARRRLRLVVAVPWGELYRRWGIAHDPSALTISAMNLNQTESLTFPTPGMSFGTLAASITAVRVPEIEDEPIFELATRAREFFGNELIGRDQDPEVAQLPLVAHPDAQAVCFGATAAFRNGYAQHWVAALAEQVNDIVTTEFLATAPRIRVVITESRQINELNGCGDELLMHDWALALLGDKDTPLPPVTDSVHGGLLEAAAGAALAIEVAGDLDHADLGGCVGTDVGCICGR